MPHLSLEGYTDIPNGKVANIATFLEMTSPPTIEPLDAKGKVLDRLTNQNLEQDWQRYITLFKRVGEPWLWMGRLPQNKKIHSQSEIKHILEREWKFLPYPKMRKTLAF